MFIAGDPSGDAHAAPVIRELRKSWPDISLWGIGGPQMTAEGFVQRMPFEPFNKMGFVEVVSHLKFFLDAKKKLIAEMKKCRPSCLVCVDYPGFNMLMMKAAKEAGIPVVWYIAPMVWAWKRKRAVTLGRCASQIACIFPFEVDYFLPYTDKVSFVGNPSVEFLENRPAPVIPDSPGDFAIALVPGSRIQEIERMLRPMLDAFRVLKAEFPSLTAKLSTFRSLDSKYFDIVKEYNGVSVTAEPLDELIKTVQCAIVKSGTATLETALSAVPMVIAYKTSTLTYRISKALVKINYIGLPNIIAQQGIVPECIQGDMNARSLAAAVRRFITDRDYYKATVDKLDGVRAVLGSKKPSVEVAALINSVL